ncbi:hypothetical protein ACIQCG_26410 [Streptomyces noursei]|uniref:hypothetical protein n=1 Tax=Streptomyces noursei TaxID=1971 RepID=UPI00381F66D5
MGLADEQVEAAVAVAVAVAVAGGGGGGGGGAEAVAGLASAPGRPGEPRVRVLRAAASGPLALPGSRVTLPRLEESFGTPTTRSLLPLASKSGREAEGALSEAWAADIPLAPVSATADATSQARRRPRDEVRVRLPMGMSS